MKELVERYLAALPERKGVTSDTLRTYRTRLRQFVSWLDAEGRLFTRIAFIEYLDYLRVDRGLQARTIRPTFSAIRDMAVWMKEQGLPAPDLEGIKPPSVQKGVSSRYEPTDADMEKLWTAAKRLPSFSLQDRMLRGKAMLIMCLAGCTAIRRCELLSLKMDDFVKVPGQDGAPDELRLRVRKGKGKKVREIPINPDAQVILAEWFETRRIWVKQQPGRAENPFLLPVDAVRPIGDSTVDQIIARLNYSAGLQYVNGHGQIRNRVTLHCIRHWAATKMAGEARKQGIGLKSISEILGHASTHTTELYLHPVREEMTAAVNGIRLFGEGKSADSAPTPDIQGSECSPPAVAERKARMVADVLRRRRLPAGRISRVRTPHS